ncbi:MAG: FCD domain-containing protein [Rhizobiaceae bacterium]|nr:FCD domain-containing protein [Rhizobiaceae bacterium]MCV0408191.1 FCD domain-containing protein [Rhizobiaceae bacterium]
MRDQAEEETRKGILEPINVPKASDVLANRLRDLILGGHIAPGESLPTERELVQESRLSRSSVREALRVLEVEGLISTRPGRSGGSTVQLPGRGSVSRSMQLFVRSHAIRLESLLECRLAVEPFLAGLAATNHTEKELEELGEIHERFVLSVDNVAAYKRINLDWHLALARASRNEVLIALMEAISQPIFDAAGYQEVTTPELRHAAVKAHAAIMSAVARRDAELARTRMQKHISAYATIARRELMGRE